MPRSAHTLLLPLLGVFAATSCGGPAANAPSSKRKKFVTPSVMNHLEAVFEVIESPPGDAGAAWLKLGPPQPQVGAVFYPDWDGARQGASMDAAWQAWATRWADMRTGIYRLENLLDGAVGRAAKAFGRTMGDVPRATVHLYFVPDQRTGAAALIAGRGHIGLNAAALALLGEAEVEREVIRQLTVLHALRRGDLPTPRTVAARAYLQGLSAWSVRAVKPRTLEGEVIGATPAGLAAAQGKVRAAGARLGESLDSTDGTTGDALFVHGDGDPTLALAGRLAAYGLLRALARDDLPAQVLNLAFATFRSRATGFWSGDTQTASGGLVEERSSAETLALERGGKTAECVGAFPVEGSPTPLDVPGGGWTRRGARVDADLGAGAITLGVIGDIKQADDDTLRNLGHFVGEFKKAGITALLVAGDVAETSAGIRDSLEVLANVEVPVLVIPGNRESYGRYRGAMAAAAKEHGNLVDMAQIRLVDAGRFSVVSLPGYYDPRYVHAKDGCLYRPEHVAALPAIAAQGSGTPKILLAHSPPKAKGKGSIDYADAGANVGDAEMTKMLHTSKAFNAGVYANLHEAGGRAARNNLKTKVRPGAWVGDIHLVTGSANAMAWPMLNGRVSHGMAGLLDIDGSGRLRYRILRAPAP